jgi:flagellar hook-length control protein FliK
MAAAQAVGAGALPGAAGSVRVTAPAASEDALPTGQQSLLSQVDGSIRWLVKNQDQGAELQLHPESLGRIQIKLKVEGTVVHAKVWASEASAVPVLQDHRSMLETSLKAQGLTLGSFDLQHGRKDQQAPLPTPSGTASSPSSNQQPVLTGQETPVLAAAAPARSSRIEYVA